jgi:hypothetical protein
MAACVVSSAIRVYIDGGLARWWPVVQVVVVVEVRGGDDQAANVELDRGRDRGGRLALRQGRPSRGRRPPGCAGRKCSRDSQTSITWKPERVGRPMCTRRPSVFAPECRRGLPGHLGAAPVRTRRLQRRLLRAPGRHHPALAVRQPPPFVTNEVSTAPGRSDSGCPFWMSWTTVSMTTSTASPYAGSHRVLRRLSRLRRSQPSAARSR